MRAAETTRVRAEGVPAPPPRGGRQAGRQLEAHSRAYTPELGEFRKLAEKHNLVPVYREIVADVDTPVSAFLKLGDTDTAFLLESVEGGERLGRYSFLGSDPYLVIYFKDGVLATYALGSLKMLRVGDPLEALKGILDGYEAATVPGLPAFYGGAVGYLSYGASRYFERLPTQATDDLGLPDMMFMLTDIVLVFDHVEHKIKVVANAHVGGTGVEEAYEKACERIDALIDKLLAAPPSVPLGQTTVTSPGLPTHLEQAAASDGLSSTMSREDFIAKVDRAKEYIRAGDIFQVVVSQRFSMPVESDPFDVYRVLRSINPSPYMYFLKDRDVHLIGSSPEPLVKVANGQAVTRPIAGTRPRGRTGEEDAGLEHELLADEKERAEHIMLVDLGRNDLGRVCRPGTVEVDDLMFVEKYSHVMHIVSNVVGELADGKTAFDVLKSVFPAGTVSGAPKIRAMEIIDELEPTQRGPYAGAVGYISYGGSLDSCITIRTIVVKKGRAYVQAGAGIVADSVPETEYVETFNKAKALLSAVETADGRLSAKEAVGAGA